VYGKRGLFVARLRIVDSRGSAAVATRVIAVIGRNRIAFRHTLVRLRASSITSFVPVDGSRGVLTLASGTSTPKVGQTVLVPPSSRLPQGLAASVDQAIRRGDGSSTLTTHDAGLTDLYRVLTFAGNASVGNGLRVLHTGT
jgi:hypothetical protein